MTLAVLLTGFPALRARAVLRELLASPARNIVLLVHADRSAEAQMALTELPESTPSVPRVRVVEGDPAALDFGLSGAQYLTLARSVVSVHSTYSTVDSSAGDQLAESVNIGAARELIEFMRVAPELHSAVHYSSVLVSGNRSGRFLETELKRGQSFRSPAERTLAIAERMLCGSGMPISILRSGHLLADFPLGAADQLSAPHGLAALVASAPKEVVLPLLSGAEALLPLTPVDYLAKLGSYVAASEKPGRTYHALSPERLSLRRFLELAAERHERRIEPGFSPTPVTRSFLGNPAARLLAQNARGILEVLTTSAEYASDAVDELVAHGAPRCPPLSHYLDCLFDHVRERLDDRASNAARRHHAPFLIA